MRKLHVLAAAAALTAGSLFADVQIGKGLSVSGYIDLTFQSRSVDETTAAGAAVAPVAGTDGMGFSAANSEIDFSMDFGGGLTARIDLDSFGPTSAGAQNTPSVEQARIDYKMGMGTLTLGKFDTFIGLEGLEATDLYQFSNSLTFGYEPTQHEGLSYAWDNGKFNFALAIVNGIESDNGNTAAPIAAGATDNDELAYAAHIGFTPNEALSFNLNYATGDGELVSASDVKLMTIDASYSNHGWTVGAEYVDRENNRGTAATTTDVTAYMLMVNYMFSEQFGLTGRYSKSDEQTGAGTELEGKEFTLAASYAVTPNWSALIEYRSEEFDAGHSGTGAVGTGYTVANKSEGDIITLETILTF
jgi:hypothetical protein